MLSLLLFTPWSSATARRADSLRPETLQKIGALYVKSIQVMVQGEDAQQVSLQPGFSLLQNAFAGSSAGCLVSGWTGNLIGKTCTPASREFEQAKQACVKSTGNAQSIACNPDLFPGKLCFVPSKARWVNDCSSQFLKSQGIKGDLDSLTDSDYRQLAKKLIDQQININEVVAKATSLCHTVKGYGREDSDCRRLNQMYRTLLTSTPQKERGDLSKFVFVQREPTKKYPTHFPLKNQRAQCSTIMNDDPNVDPVRNQGEGKTCFAYAAVEIMNHGRKSKISDFATALQHDVFAGKKDYREIESNTEFSKIFGFNGGTIGNALRAANNFGPCLESAVASRQGDNFEQYYLNLMRLYESYQIEKKGRNEAACGLIEDSAVAQIRNLQKSMSDALIANSNSKQPLELNTQLDQNYREILRKAQTLDQFLSGIVVFSCQGLDSNDRGMIPSNAIDFKDVAINNQADGEKAIDEIHASLESGDIKGIAYYTDGLIQEPKDTFQSHASVVVGRSTLEDPAMLKGQPKGCYLLVKNSWGKEWPGNQLGSRYKGIADPARPGYFWVSERNLANHLKSYTNVIYAKKP